jgi:hypothetical protein
MIFKSALCLLVFALSSIAYSAEWKPTERYTPRSDIKPNEKPSKPEKKHDESSAVFGINLAKDESLQTINETPEAKQKRLMLKLARLQAEAEVSLADAKTAIKQAQMSLIKTTAKTERYYMIETQHRWEVPKRFDQKDLKFILDFGNPEHSKLMQKDILEYAAKGYVNNGEIKNYIDPITGESVMEIRLDKLAK